MNLSDIRSEVDSYTGGASSVNRQMALAGIAVIWIMVKQDSSLAIQNGALWLFVAALSSDLLQYVCGAISSKILDIVTQVRLKKKYGDDGKKIEDEDFEISIVWNVPTWICFFAKIVFVLLGYNNLLHQLPIPDSIL